MGIRILCVMSIVMRPEIGLSQPELTPEERSLIVPRNVSIKMM